jgi:hypothetical protein
VQLLWNSTEHARVGAGEYSVPKSREERCLSDNIAHVRVEMIQTYPLPNQLVSNSFRRAKASRAKWGQALLTPAQ